MAPPSFCTVARLVEGVLAIIGAAAVIALLAAMWVASQVRESEREL